MCGLMIALETKCGEGTVCEGSCTCNEIMLCNQVQFCQFVIIFVFVLRWVVVFRLVMKIVFAFVFVLCGGGGGGSGGRRRQFCLRVKATIADRISIVTLLSGTYSAWRRFFVHFDTEPDTNL